MRISVILPFLNEIQCLESCLDEVRSALEAAPGDWEVLLSDSGSTDGSLGVAEAGVASLPNAQVIPWAGGAPSVGRAVAQAAEKATGDLLWVLPVDCHVSPEAWGALQQAVGAGARCGAFPKTYVPSSILLRWYAWGQNQFRLRWGRNGVWTNALFFRCTQSIPTLGFLEDVQLSDELRKQKDWVTLPVPVQVSSRRYYPNRTLRRILLNGTILFAYRVLGISPPRLKRWYLSIK